MLNMREMSHFRHHSISPFATSFITDVLRERVRHINITQSSRQEDRKLVEINKRTFRPGRVLSRDLLVLKFV